MRQRLKNSGVFSNEATRLLTQLVALQIKRRTKVVSIFPNEAAIVRLVGALLLEQNDEWQLNRRYMQLEGLRSLAGNSPARVSAVAQ